MIEAVSQLLEISQLGVIIVAVFSSRHEKHTMCFVCLVILSYTALISGKGIVDFLKVDLCSYVS